MPLHTRCEKDDERKNEKWKQEANIPEGNVSEQVTRVEDEPRARVKSLNQGIRAFTITPGD
jgi:hypothetical protein